MRGQGECPGEQWLIAGFECAPPPVAVGDMQPSCRRDCVVPSGDVTAEQHCYSQQIFAGHLHVTCHRSKLSEKQARFDNKRLGFGFACSPVAPSSDE